MNVLKAPRIKLVIRYLPPILYMNSVNNPLQQCGQSGHISRDCTNPPAEGAGRGGSGGGYSSGGGSQECYKVGCSAVNKGHVLIYSINSVAMLATLLVTAQMQVPVVVISVAIVEATVAVNSAARLVTRAGK